MTHLQHTVCIAPGKYAPTFWYDAITPEGRIEQQFDPHQFGRLEDALLFLKRNFVCHNSYIIHLWLFGMEIEYLAFDKSEHVALREVSEILSNRVKSMKTEKLFWGEDNRCDIDVKIVVDKIVNFGQKLEVSLLIPLDMIIQAHPSNDFQRDEYSRWMNRIETQEGELFERYIKFILSDCEMFSCQKALIFAATYHLYLYYKNRYGITKTQQEKVWKIMKQKLQSAQRGFWP